MVCFGNCRQKGKNYQFKGNVRPKPCSQHLASEAKILFSVPFQTESFSLAMSQIEMVVYARETWLGCSELGRTAARITISLLFLCFSKMVTFLDHLGGFSYARSCSWTESGLCIQETPQPEIWILATGRVKVMQNLCGKRSRNLIYWGCFQMCKVKKNKCEN